MVVVSIIVDVSNTSENLSLTLSMIARQTYTDYELLIVGDAATTNIIAEFPSQSLSKVPLQVSEQGQRIKISKAKQRESLNQTKISNKT